MSWFKPKKIGMSTLAVVFVLTVLSSVADPDPGSGAVVTLGFGIRGPGWVKNQDPDTGTGMNIPNHISESVKTIF